MLRTSLLEERVNVLTVQFALEQSSCVQEMGERFCERMEMLVFKKFRRNQAGERSDGLFSEMEHEPDPELMMLPYMH